MRNGKLYLKPNVVIEPLIDKWYAWSHLVSPATFAMNITGRHLKIMDSYIQAPAAHAAAVKTPKMRGGPFIDYGGKRVDEVETLRKETMEKRKEQIALSNAIKELDTLLKTKANGFSLEPLYAQVPEMLKGYVELLYDLDNQPSFRLFEALLYKSRYYDACSQSIAIWLTENDERPFVLSTPRLSEPHSVHVDIPFHDELVDALSAMKRNPGDYERIKTEFRIPPEKEDVFRSFFTEEPPKKYERYTGDKVRMRYFGHACILIETSEVSILLDPLISYYGYPQEVHHFSEMHLPEEIDYVLITHNHQDHVLFETLLPLRHRIRNLVIPRSGKGFLQDPNLKLMFEHIGFKKVIEIEEMETLSFDNCAITGLPFLGEHCDLNVQCKICHFVQVGKFRMLFAADSCNVEPKVYEHITSIVGGADVVFLGMECDGAPLSWLYGPLLPESLSRDKDSSRRLAGSNFERGRSLVEAFDPREVYVYAMGQEPWVEFVSSIKYTDESNPIIQSNKLIAHLTGKGVIAERLFGEKEILYNK